MAPVFNVFRFVFLAQTTQVFFSLFVIYIRNFGENVFLSMEYIYMSNLKKKYGQPPNSVRAGTRDRTRDL